VLSLLSPAIHKNAKSAIEHKLGDLEKSHIDREFNFALHIHSYLLTIDLAHLLQYALEFNIVELITSFKRSIKYTLGIRRFFQNQLYSGFSI
jgi:hypothetical protein